jgi:hypothetical protein
MPVITMPSNWEINKTLSQNGTPLSAHNVALQLRIKALGILTISIY